MKTKKTVVQPNKEGLLKRMNKIIGQARGLSTMIEENRYCIDILNQISAAKNALDSVAMRLLEDHTKHCVYNALKKGSGSDEIIEELITVIRKSR